MAIVVGSRRSVLHAIKTTSFVEQAFDENTSDLRYRIQPGMMLFEQLSKERSPFPKIYYWIALGIAPFYLILSRLHPLIRQLFGEEPDSASLPHTGLASACGVD
ncbi:MAG: hypothetical protein QOF74_6869 [Caballeronia mineralivorans]|jgi:hypothetical protein|nr:hypothetical protein [Caballeronia mineralivorans]